MEAPMLIKTTCLKCGQEQRIDFGELSLLDAMEAINKLDTPGECPGGYHVELSGWPMLWQLGSALVLVYGTEAEKMSSVQGMIAREQSYREARSSSSPKPEVIAQAA